MSETRFKWEYRFHRSLKEFMVILIIASEHREKGHVFILFSCYMVELVPRSKLLLKATTNYNMIKKNILNVSDCL